MPDRHKINDFREKSEGLALISMPDRHKINDFREKSEGLALGIRNRAWKISKLPK